VPNEMQDKHQQQFQCQSNYSLLLLLLIYYWLWNHHFQVVYTLHSIYLENYIIFRQKENLVLLNQIDKNISNKNYKKYGYVKTGVKIEIFLKKLHLHHS
jgi:hypothetical protein